MHHEFRRWYDSNLRGTYEVGYVIYHEVNRRFWIKFAIFLGIIALLVVVFLIMIA